MIQAESLQQNTSQRTFQTEEINSLFIGSSEVEAIHVRVAMVTDMHNQLWNPRPQPGKHPHQDSVICLRRECHEDVTVAGRDGVQPHLGGHDQARCAGEGLLAQDFATRWKKQQRLFERDWVITGDKKSVSGKGHRSAWTSASTGEWNSDALIIPESPMETHPTPSHSVFKAC